MRTFILNEEIQRSGWLIVLVRLGSKSMFFPSSAIISSILDLHGIAAIKYQSLLLVI